ncbi:MAG: M48 family metallopeptidase [Thaumarchaeota archaeon]|nr:M48 family metallopeptidase [Nitrososphaerota archaeon]
MDAGGLYLRIFLGARAFKSSELDSLAENMSVSSHLSSNAGERYFLTKTNIAALSLGNKLLFGARYYSSLTEGQRLAVAAHEFGHVLGDGGERMRRLVFPAVAVSVLFAFAVALGTGSTLALMFASMLGFTGAVAALSTIDSDHYLKHEMSCDKIAASFADGEALVQAIHVAESLRNARTNRLASFWKRVGTNPSTKLRVDAILNGTLHPD